MNTEQYVVTINVLQRLYFAELDRWAATAR
jgi:hypothetical protein